MMLRDTLAFRTLLAVARQRTALDEPRCRAVLELLSTAALVRGTLHQQLQALGLNELKFGVLIGLFVLDPSPCTVPDLAAHLGVTRSAVADALAQIEDRGLVCRQRDERDRRSVYFSLTDSGRAAADDSMSRYLANVAHAARYVDTQVQPHLLTLCAQLNEGAQRLQSES